MTEQSQIKSGKTHPPFENTIWLKVGQVTQSIMELCLHHFTVTYEGWEQYILHSHILVKSIFDRLNISMADFNTSVNILFYSQDMINSEMKHGQ